MSCTFSHLTSNPITKQTIAKSYDSVSLTCGGISPLLCRSPVVKHRYDTFMQRQAKTPQDTRKDSCSRKKMCKGTFHYKITAFPTSENTFFFMKKTPKIILHLNCKIKLRKQAIKSAKMPCYITGCVLSIAVSYEVRNTLDAHSPHSALKWFQKHGNFFHKN